MIESTQKIRLCEIIAMNCSRMSPRDLSQACKVLHRLGLNENSLYFPEIISAIETRFK